MSYNKTTWENGDTITAEKLNNIENGVEKVDAKGGLIEIAEEGGMPILQASYNEVTQLVSDGILPFIKGTTEIYTLIESDTTENGYYVTFNNPNTTITFVSQDADDKMSPQNV